MPKGAVASVLVNAGKKKTTFLDRACIEKNPAGRCFRPYVHTNLIAQDRILVTHFGLRSSFPFRAILFPFGFPVAVSSHSEAVIAIAHAEWDQWQQAFDDPPIELTFEVSPHNGWPGSDRPPASTFRGHEHLFTVVADANNVATGDTRARKARATLHQSAIDDRPYFVYHFLDAMAFQLITSLNFTPMHGSTVARNGRGVLITGDSGQGKSSLSYACARHNWTFVSDDASHLLRRRASERLIVGAPHHIRLRPDAPQLFPELATFTPAIRGNGKLSLQIRTRELSIATAPTTPVDAIVLPHRVSAAHSKAPARLEKIAKDSVREYCAQWFYHWDPPVLAEQRAAFEKMLSGARTFSLEYSDLDAAADVLHDALATALLP
jgi:hypothetical protein